MEAAKNGAMGILVFKEAFSKQNRKAEEACKHIGKHQDKNAWNNSEIEATGSHQLYITHTNTTAADKTDPFQKPAAENSAFYTQ